MTKMECANFIEIFITAFKGYSAQTWLNEKNTKQ